MGVLWPLCAINRLGTSTCEDPGFNILARLCIIRELFVKPPLYLWISGAKMPRLGAINYTQPSSDVLIFGLFTADLCLKRNIFNLMSFQLLKFSA